MLENQFEGGGLESQKPISAAKFWEEVLKGSEDLEIAKSRRIESIRQITDGIKRRLGDRSLEALKELYDHLYEMPNYLKKTFDECFDDITGKNSGVVAPSEIIDSLPWIINHDDSKLGIRAGEVISLEEFMGVVKEVIELKKQA